MIHLDSKARKRIGEIIDSWRVNDDGSTNIDGDNIDAFVNEIIDVELYYRG